MFPTEEMFYSLLKGKKASGKEYENVLKVWNKFEMRRMKNYRNLYLKIWCFIVR